jgi:hypothetical protein
MTAGAVPLGGVHPGDLGLTDRVVAAVTKARRSPRVGHPITDQDGPHEHHWQAILWICRGCGEFDPPYDDGE